VLPIAIQGLEESMPVAFTVKPLKSILGTYAGYPLLPFPLPSKFKMSFCKPIDLSEYAQTHQNDLERMDRIAEEIRSIVQSKLNQEAYHRPLAKLSRFVTQFVYSGASSSLQPLFEDIKKKRVA
jgi:1-acyl-sn-glycerol-3-phosphate acyltransferase